MSSGRAALILRIELAERAGRGVARIGKWRLARRDALVIEPLERAPRQDHFAAHLEQPRHPAVRRMDQAQRHAFDCADVPGHVFAVDSVAASRSHGQPAVFIDQLDRETVELDLGDVLDFGLAVEKALDAIVELAHLLGIHRVGERHHHPAMDDDGEFFARTGADALGGGIRREEFGMLALERFEPAHQGVVLGVGQLGIVEDVIEMVVTVYLLAQLVDFRPRALEIVLRHRRSVYGWWIQRFA